MEISLVSKRGVPEDAIISIRSGAVRRQGAVGSDRPFRFPSGVSEADCVVKVDLMQNIGSGYLVMRPNQKEDKQYEVIMNNNQDMACEVAVKPAVASALAAPASEEEAADAAKSKQDAKAYLESTGLLPFVQGVLQVVAKQRPEDPFAAMAKHFVSASDEAVQPTPGSPKVAPTSPKSLTEGLAKATEEPAKAAAPTEEVTPVAPESPKAEERAPAEADAKGENPAPQAEEKPPEEKPVDGEKAEAHLGEAQQEAAKVEDDKAESDHVDENKSDTLEEFTAKVTDASQAGEALAGAAAVMAGAPVGAAATAIEAAGDAGEAAKPEEPPKAEEPVAADELAKAE